MVDLHSHALFDIDDGAGTIEDSVAILKRAVRCGIDKMALTPHFTIGDDVDAFLDARNRRFEKLKETVHEEDINIKLCMGAEVYITDELFNETQLESLAIGESRVILCEFKYHSLRPEQFLGYIDEIMTQGLTPIVAHPERYSYMVPMLVNSLLDRGALLQVNGISLYEDSEEGEVARALVKSGCAFAVGSDIHHAESRRLTAMGKLNESGKWQKILHDNPNKIFENLL